MHTPHILLVTHRRSGTHLTIDLLRNNFIEYGKPYISLNEIMKKNNSDYVNKFSKRIQSSPRIFKSHSDINYYGFHQQPSIIELYKHLLNKAKIIYVVREPKDTLTSLYFHYLKYKPEYAAMSVNDFIFSVNEYHVESYTGNLNRVEYWKYHVDGWANRSDILLLSFDDIISNYHQVVAKISNYLNLQPREKILDVRLNQFSFVPEKNNKPVLIDGGIHYTTESFRAGEIEGYLKHLSPATIDRVNDSIADFYNKIVNGL